MSQRYRPRFSLWLLVGVALHVMGGVGFRFVMKQLRPALPAESPSLIELTLEELEEPPVPAAAPVPPGAAPPVAGATPASPAQQAAARAAAGKGPVGKGMVGKGTVGKGSVGKGVVPGAVTESGAAGPSSSASSPAPEGDEGEAVASPHALSLEALGVGQANPFLRDYERVKSSAAERLSASLRSAIAFQDQSIGLGPEGPATSAVIDIVQQGTTSPDGAATLRVHTDATGSVLRSEVIAASGDTREWELIADALVKALHGRKLRIPHGANGMSFDLKVTSREQLPSGASPGLEVNLFGVTLKHGRGDRPTQLNILTPDIHIASTPLDNDPLGRSVGSLVVQFNILGFNGDPTDIGAPARRVVHARLTDLTVY
jgi:hypothetical protein